MPQQNESLRFMRGLWQLVHSLDVRSKWMARHLGVTGPQRLVLRVVGHAPDIGASAIATSLEMHPSTLTGILARLEQRGYLRRIADPKDRRRAKFRLTPQGVRIDRERTGTVEAAVTRALARCGRDEIAFTELVLGRVVRELERALPPSQTAPKRRRGAR
jgi:DNA-binding MarR family transcriptional regulator